MELLKAHVTICTNDETLEQAIWDDAIQGMAHIDNHDEAVMDAVGDFDGDTARVIVDAATAAVEALADEFVPIELNYSQRFEDWHGGKFGGGPVHVQMARIQRVDTTDDIRGQDCISIDALEVVDWEWLGDGPKHWMATAVAGVAERAMERAARKMARAELRKAAEFLVQNH